jgi:hypothetical protein
MDGLSRRPPRRLYALSSSRTATNLGVLGMDVNDAVRKEYCRPEIEDLGSLHELTAAGGPNFNVDSAYVHGDPNAGFGVS